MSGPEYQKPSFNSPRVPSIAIIGMEGSGKTVMATVLAKRLSTIDSRGVFLNPQGVKTLKYVENVWNTLQSGDWPSSTPPGELFELRWKFQIIGELECNVRLIDAAGQDLRLLFGDERILAVDDLPGNLRALAEYCRNAEIVLFLVNLKDFVGQGNSEQRTANEAAIKSAMDFLRSDGRPLRVCLLLTQADLYINLAKKYGGWQQLAAHAIPYVFSAHVKAHQVTAFPVSAVSDTQVVVDSDGTPRRVPVADFRSKGLDKIVFWLTEQVRDIEQELKKEGESRSLPQKQTTMLPVAQPPNSTTTNKSNWSDWIWRIVVIISVLFFLRGCIFSAFPVATIFKNEPVRTGIFDHGLSVTGKVRNDGAAGTIRVIATVMEKGKEVEIQKKDYYLTTGQTTDFAFQMNKIDNWNNWYNVLIRAVVN